MTLTDTARAALVRKLAHEVTFQDQEPYPELQKALEALINAVSSGGIPDNSVDWPAVIAEATSLRPQH